MNNGKRILTKLSKANLHMVVLSRTSHQWCVLLVGDKRLTENSYFEIKFFEIDLATKKFFFDFEFSVSLTTPTTCWDIQP